MLKFASDLSDDFEVALVAWGQSNTRPWGSKAEGYGESPHLDLSDVGVNLTGIIIAGGEETGTNKTLDVGTVLVANKWAGAQLRLGTTAAPLGGYATIRSNTASTIVVDWVVAAAAPGTFSGYLVRADGRWASYENVRVLTPFQPEGPDVATSVVPYPAGTVFAPGYTLPAGISTFTDLGVFLPFTFLEGVDSHGICEATDSYTAPATHAATAATATSLTFLNAVVANAFAGGFIRVQHDGGTSWATITTNTTLVFTVPSWSGAGTPTGTPSTWIYEAWVPHFNNSPHAFLPGKGFRYPNNDMQPAAFGDGRIHNRPRGITTFSYGDRFGMLIELAWRLSIELGRRVNIIHLGVNSAGQILRNTENFFGFFGTLGWWDYTKHLDWTPSNPDGLAARLQRMIQVMAPAALTAEGSTKKLRIIGILGMQGETDALSVAGREMFGETLTAFYLWLRGVIQDVSLSPYSSAAKIPIVHPRITNIPWELSGTFLYYGVPVVLSGDSGKLVNIAIEEFVAKDGFAATANFDASPKLVTDLGHFNGVGEARNGELVADAMGALVDLAISQGLGVKAVDICNLALSHIGDVAKVTSIEPPDGSAQAALCARYYPVARDMLLELRQWGFAARRKALTKVTTPVLDEWDFVYAVPADALNIVAVHAPGVSDDYVQPSRVTFDNQTLLSPLFTSYVPQTFAVEQDQAGNKVLYTDQDTAVLRYVARVVDVTQYPPLFVMAMSWQLAALLAGPIIKGAEGAAEAKRAISMMMFYLGKAESSDGNRRLNNPQQVVPWMAGR